MTTLDHTQDVHEIQRDGRTYVVCDNGFDCCHAQNVHLTKPTSRETCIKWFNTCYSMEERRRAR